MNDRDPHLAHQLLAGAAGPFERSPEDRDLVRKDHRVALTALGQRDPFVKTEQTVLGFSFGAIGPFARAVPGGLLGRRLVLDDDVDVVEHGQDLLG